MWYPSDYLSVGTGDSFWGVKGRFVNLTTSIIAPNSNPHVLSQIVQMYNKGISTVQVIRLHYVPSKVLLISPALTRYSSGCNFTLYESAISNK